MCGEGYMRTCVGGTCVHLTVKSFRVNQCVFRNTKNEYADTSSFFNACHYIESLKNRYR